MDPPLCGTLEFISAFYLKSYWGRVYSTKGLMCEGSMVCALKLAYIGFTRDLFRELSAFWKGRDSRRELSALGGATSRECIYVRIHVNF